MLLPLLLLAPLGCGPHPGEEPPPAPAVGPPAAPPPAPDGEATAASPPTSPLYRALSLRDGGPGCADLGSLSGALVPELITLVEQDPPPPWVAMRAADCLARAHTAEALPQLQSWVADPEARGLCLIVLGALDAAPLDPARVVAQAALSGPWAADAREQLAASTRPELTALVVQPR